MNFLPEGWTEPKLEYGLFDLTAGDISQVEIKERMSKQGCDIVGGGEYYSGFILSKKSDTETRCEITFHPSKTSNLYKPRLTFSIVKVSKNETKDSKNPAKVRIAFSTSEEGVNEFWKMIAFLARFKDLVDLGDFDEKYRVASADAIVLELQGLEEGNRIKALVDYAQRSGVSLKDFNNTALQTERRTVLDEFKKLLTEEEFWKDYETRNKSDMTGTGEEAVWHHFLKKNDWLLGLNLRIRFIEDFTNEVSVGNPDTENQGNPKVDLMGLSDYTVLVELKTPNTDIFTPTKSTGTRAGTWSFTPAFIDGFSQCLAQKSAWEKESASKDLVKDGNVVSQDTTRTVDPKTIYIVGCKKREIPSDSTSKDVFLKRDTFERFRRNNRNVEIITFDELYERANFIVNGSDK